MAAKRGDAWRSVLTPEERDALDELTGATRANEEPRYKVPTSAELAYFLRELSAELYAAAQLDRKPGKVQRVKWNVYASHAEAIAAVLDGTARSVPGDKV